MASSDGGARRAGAGRARPAMPWLASRVTCGDEGLLWLVHVLEPTRQEDADDDDLVDRVVYEMVRILDHVGALADQEANARWSGRRRVRRDRQCADGLREGDQCRAGGDGPGRPRGCRWGSGRGATGRAVAGEVLGPGDDVLGRPEALDLEASALGRGHDGPQVGVLARALHDAAPPPVVGDVHHRGERPVDADRPGLAGRDRLGALHRPRVPWPSHRDQHRDDGAQAVDDVEAEQRRDAVVNALDRQPLRPVDLGRVCHEQQRARPTLGERLLDLAGCLRRGPDRRVRRAVRRLEANVGSSCRARRC